jgi:holo-[acyl-carrier protein] synthase
MTIGIGIDLVEISRVQTLLERYGQRLLDKLFHPSELTATLMEPSAPTAPARVAARFAAKEAAVKALGTGFTQGIGLRDVRVVSLESGQPTLSFHGKAEERARALGVTRTLLSLTHARDTAGAVVVLE